VWTVNDAAAMERLVGLGVDGIISDVPTVLAGVLRNHRVAWDGRPR
jgi:glycerophosphoryl diester phosphodiesterase